MIEYTLKRSKRKSIGISISETGEVIVSAPNKLAAKEISKIIDDKSSWIRSKLAIVNQRIDTCSPKKFTTGETFAFLGNEYLLDITTNSRQVTISNGALSVGISSAAKSSSNSDFIKRKVIHWYREQAQKYIDTNASKYSVAIGVMPEIIKEKAYKRSWGMCHSSGKIYINYKLIMAPAAIIDYVLIHELCHLIHPNHSIDFWNLVEKHCPDYKQRRNWLKEYGYQLNF